MRKVLASLGALLIGVLTGGLAMSPPAVAAEKVIEDGADADLPARMDILEVAIDNREDRVVLRLTLRDLTETRRSRVKV